MKFYINVLAILFMVSSFLLADLLKPYDGQYISYIHILFEWEQEPDADNYNIQVSANSNFTNLILDLNTSSLVYIFKGDINKGMHLYNVDFEGYHSGQYFVKMKSENFIGTKKVVLVK